MLHGPRQTWEFLSSAASKINLFLISASLTGSYASEPQTYGVQNSDKTDNVNRLTRPLACLLACLRACLLAWRLFVSHFGRGGGYGVSRRFFQIRIRMVGLLSAIGRCGFTLRPTHRCPANPSLVSACRRSASPVAGGCCGLRFRL